MATPFLKWAGGKRQLLSVIENSLPDEFKQGKIKKFAEPFFGAGAVFFYLSEKYDIEETYISDTNIDLISAMQIVKDSVDELIEHLKALTLEYKKKSDSKREEYFYQVRDKYNKTPIKKAVKLSSSAKIKRTSQMIFMNKTCFNGLFRVNQKGFFNVPFGRHKNPQIFDEKRLRNASALLQNTIIEANCYSNIPQKFLSDSFIYFDPPYRPLPGSRSFTAYNKSSFNDINQQELASYFNKLSKNKNLFLMLSNSDPKNTNENDNFFDDLYQDFNINRIFASRLINSKWESRGQINELLITNYPV